MRFIETALPGVIIVEPARFGDARGFFMETWHAGKFAGAGLPTSFVQENHSRSRRGTLRGLHYQVRHPQGKLVRVVAGAIFDVSVDLRATSPTFGRWLGVELSAESGRELWIPPGFAHGFYVTSESADVVYLCTELYHPEHERTIRWDDPAIGIAWPIPAGEAPLLSAKDRDGVALHEAERPMLEGAERPVLADSMGASSDVASGAPSLTVP